MMGVSLTRLQRHCGRRLTTVFSIALIGLVLAGSVWAEELAPGDRGSAVMDLQEALSDQGYDVGLIDGVYGNRTRTAVRQFQLDTGLTPTGKVNELTWQAVFAEDTVAEEDESGLSDEFDFSEWGFESGGTSLEIGGVIQTGIGSKFQDSDARFPFFYFDQNQALYTAMEPTDKTSYQKNFGEIWFKGDFPGNLSAYAAFDVAHYSSPERPFGDDVEIEIDEAYLTYAGEEISWTVGKEKVNWGVMDVISPFNILNSADMMDPFVNSGLHDQRGQWGVHFNWDKVGSHRLEAIFVPVWNRSLVPEARTSDEFINEVEADYWMPPIFTSVPSLIYIVNALVIDNQVYDMAYQNEFDGLKKPDKDLSTFSLGLRYLATKGDYDLGAYFITSKDPKPTVSMDIQFGQGQFDFGNGNNFTAPTVFTRIEQDFSRVYVGGASVETVKGKFRLKQETAVTYGRRFFPDITNVEGMQELFRRVVENQNDYGTYTEVGDRYAALNLLFGSEYTIPGADIITSLQLGYRHRFGYEDIYFGSADNLDITLYGQKSFAKNQFTASLSTLFDTTGGSVYMTPRLRFVPMFAQSLELGLGFNFYFGESEELSDDLSTYSGVMGSYQKYSNVFLTGKYLFGFEL